LISLFAAGVVLSLSHFGQRRGKKKKRKKDEERKMSESETI
jgi:hypothetical protein